MIADQMEHQSSIVQLSFNYCGVSLEHFLIRSIPIDPRFRCERSIAVFGIAST